MTTDPTIANNSTPPSKDYYTALHRAAMTFSSSLDLNQVLQHIVETVTSAMQVKAAVIRLLDPSTDQLVIGAAQGLSPDYIDKGPVKVAHSPIDSETLCCYPVYIPDVRVDSRFQYQEAARREGLASVLSVPLEVHSRAIGVMRVYTSEQVLFDDSDVKFLSVLSSLAALSIENARLYEGMKDSYTGVVAAFWGTSLTA